MTSRDFCFWLQGFLELEAAGMTRGMIPVGLNVEQTESLRQHLALVFKHEIDPSMGGPKEQAALNALHNQPHSSGHVMRC